MPNYKRHVKDKCVNLFATGIREKNGESQMEMKHQTEHEIIRKKRNKKRRTTVMMQKIGIAAAVVAVIGGGIYGYNQIPSVKVDKCISQAKEYEEVQDYENAIASYEEALEIESTTVKTYQYMANLYIDMDDLKAAEEILHKGVEETQDSQIQESYHTVMLNESVYEVNEASCSFITVDRCLDILAVDNTKASAYDLLHTCYERLVGTVDEAGVNTVLSSTEEGLGFDSYKAAVEKMIALYEKDQNEEMKEILLKYVGIQAENLFIPMEYFDAYVELVAKVDAVATNDGLEDLQACLAKTVEIHDLFAPLLAEFEAENYKVARDFIVSDEYIAIRDAFIEGTMEYWHGKTYIPVSNIGVKLHFMDNSWKFSFEDEEEKPAEYGYIKVWGFKWLDNGHQRTAITYVPVSETKEYYPMTEYAMMYWWSTPINMELTENTFARMNFRFEENIYTEEGKTTKAINDWGGKYQYRDTYE